MKSLMLIVALVFVPCCNRDPLPLPTDDAGVGGDGSNAGDSGIDATPDNGVDLAAAPDLQKLPDLAFTCGALFCPNANSRAVAKAGMELDPPFGVTVESWVYPTSPHQNAEGGVIVAHMGGPVAQGHGMAGYRLQLDPFDNIAFTVGLSDGTTLIVTSQSSIPLNTWSHVAGVLDTAAQRVAVFIDGQLSASKATTATLRAEPSANLALCNYETASLAAPTNFPGAISWLRVSKGARYTMAFPPEHTFTMDPYTMALYSCAAALNGMSVPDSSGSMNNASLLDGAYIGVPPICP